jgi:hypothetical protein
VGAKLNGAPWGWLSIEDDDESFPLSAAFVAEDFGSEVNINAVPLVVGHAERGALVKEVIVN